MALRRVWKASPNSSGRSGAVRLIIVHTAEGALTHESLGNFFASSSSGVSSHTGIDDKAGECGEYVKPDRASWTAGNVNGVAVQTELCAFAKWDRAEWLRHPNMLENCRQWIAEEAARFAIPLVKLTSAQATSGGRGVCGHVDVSGPGGHWDPGPPFPWDIVLQGAPTTPPQPSGDDDLPLNDADKAFITKTVLDQANANATNWLRSKEFNSIVATACREAIAGPQFKQIVLEQDNANTAHWLRSKEFKQIVSDACKEAMK